jgi:hypothetical protein
MIMDASLILHTVLEVEVNGHLYVLASLWQKKASHHIYNVRLGEASADLDMVARRKAPVENQTPVAQLVSIHFNDWPIGPVPESKTNISLILI